MPDASTATEGEPVVREHAALLSRPELSPLGRVTCENSQDARIAVLDLLQAGLAADAARVLPLLLPIRRSIWWGCLAAWHACRPKPNTRDASGLRAAAGWVLQPTEERRRTAEQMAATIGIDTAAGAVTQAAALAGSIREADGPLELAFPEVAARAVSSTAMLASRHSGGLDFDPLRGLVLLGLEVARGNLLWPEVETLPPGFDPLAPQAEEQTS